MATENVMEQQIQEKAYTIWEREGRPDGRAMDHWVKAKSELGLDEPLLVARPRAKAAKTTRPSNKNSKTRSRKSQSAAP